MSTEIALRESAAAKRHARDLVERARPIGASDRILDLGCGTGIVARVLRERLGGAATIVGVDASPAMLEEARSIDPEIDWRQGSAVRLPFADRSFDLVFCQGVLALVPDRAAALREVRRVLSPAGRFLVSRWRRRGEQAIDACAFAEAGFADVRLETIALTEFDDIFGAPLVADLATASASRSEQHAIRIQTHGGNHDVPDR